RERLQPAARVSRRARAFGDGVFRHRRRQEAHDRGVFLDGVACALRTNEAASNAIVRKTHATGASELVWWPIGSCRGLICSCRGPICSCGPKICSCRALIGLAQREKHSLSPRHFLQRPSATLRALQSTLQSRSVLLGILERFSP